MIAGAHTRPTAGTRRDRAGHHYLERRTRRGLTAVGRAHQSVRGTRPTSPDGEPAEEPAGSANEHTQELHWTEDDARQVLVGGNERARASRRWRASRA